jgi:hypothetical protein
MLLKELIFTEAFTKKIYHSSTEKFSIFKAGIAWFSLNKADALGWHKSGKENNDKQITYICRFTGGKIASIKQAENIAKRIWPDEDFLYSMFDENVGEFDEGEVRSFLSLMVEAGFDGSYIEDYDPNDFNSGSSLSLAVFDASKHVKIEGVLKDELKMGYSL